MHKKKITVKKAVCKKAINRSITSKRAAGKKAVIKKVHGKSFISKRAAGKKAVTKKAIGKKTTGKSIISKKATGRKSTGKSIIHKKTGAKKKSILPIYIKRNVKGKVVKKQKKISQTKKFSRPHVIVVSGTPGSGKSTLCMQIEKEHGFLHLDVNKVIKDQNLREGYDLVRKCDIVDTKKLNAALMSVITNSKKPIVIDSHMAHSLPLKYVDICIITKCELKELGLRLRKRGYDEKKVRENIDSEIFDVCYTEAIEAGHDVIVVHTNNADKQIGLAQFRKKIALLGTCLV